MPEMPEVETIRRYLEKNIVGRRITKVDILLPRQIELVTPEAFQAMAEGQEITALDRRGKFLLLDLASGDVIVIHLRMTGRLVYCPDGHLDDAYVRQVFHLDNGAALVFADTRTFGRLYGVHPGDEDLIHGLATLGPEPLTDAFSVDYLAAACRKRKKGAIKALLLNQQVIAGIGNIYADEALFLAGLHPRRTPASLNEQEIKQLHAAVNSVIAAGIRDGGTTFRDYRNGAGGKGGHQDNLNVYYREGQPCHRCGTIIEYTKLGGRGTHFCPHCQPYKA